MRVAAGVILIVAIVSMWYFRQNWLDSRETFLGPVELGKHIQIAYQEFKQPSYGGELSGERPIYELEGHGH